jgi:hypothetical protein
VLRASFVRTVGERDRIYVTRSNGSEVSWAFATYGESLPHDLVHLVVEAAFGLRRGFWGRVDEGVDPGRVSDAANRIGGKKKYAAYGDDQAELMTAEALAAELVRAEARVVDVRAACTRFGVAAPATLNESLVARTRGLLAELEQRWRRLRPKGALDLCFDREAPERGFDQALRDAAARERGGA